MASAAEQLAANINFGAFAKATELKQRIWFTIGALIIYRLGTYIPLPGIDPIALESLFRQQSGGIIGMFDMFSGGALRRMTIFALNIMPYISASIIMQLMSSISPSLEAIKKEGRSGRKQINQYTRLLTVPGWPPPRLSASPTGSRPCTPRPGRSSRRPGSSSTSPPWCR